MIGYNTSQIMQFQSCNYPSEASLCEGGKEEGGGKEHESQMYT